MYLCYLLSLFLTKKEKMHNLHHMSRLKSCNWFPGVISPIPDRNFSMWKLSSTRSNVCVNFIYLTNNVLSRVRGRGGPARSSLWCGRKHLSNKESASSAAGARGRKYREIWQEERRSSFLPQLLVSNLQLLSTRQNGVSSGWVLNPWLFVPKYDTFCNWIQTLSWLELI